MLLKKAVEDRKVRDATKQRHTDRQKELFLLAIPLKERILVFLEENFLELDRTQFSFQNGDEERKKTWDRLRSCRLRVDDVEVDVRDLDFSEDGSPKTPKIEKKTYWIDLDRRHGDWVTHEVTGVKTWVPENRLSIQCGRAMFCRSLHLVNVMRAILGDPAPVNWTGQVKSARAAFNALPEDQRVILMREFLAAL
tara:strand:- start:19419 stop:20003 length:585 start_codon:yes stop_codon:yes gene_type:complete